MRLTKIIILVGLSGCFVCGSLKAGESLTEFFPLADGNRWEYRVSFEDRERTLIRIVDGQEDLGGLKVFKLINVNGDSELLYQAAGEVSLVKVRSAKDDGYSVYQPPLLIFPALAKKGETKKVKSVLSCYAEDGSIKESGTNELEITLEDRGEVSVEAGRFTDCIKFLVKSQGKRNDVDPTHYYYRMDWFAPGVGLVERTQFETVHSHGQNTTSTSFTRWELKGALINGKQFGELTAEKD